MTIQALPAVLQTNTPMEAGQLHAASGDGIVKNPFSTALHDLSNADNALAALAHGEAESLHSTMLTLEKAKLSMQLLVQIRNRLLGAWQELMREQI